MTQQCQTCKDVTKKTVVDSMLAKGLSAVFISHELTNKLNMPVTAQAVLNHKKHFLPPIEPPKNERDLAILVRDRTIEAIEKGRLEPNVRDGLTAQGLLDRRAEKVDDRNTALMLARLLSGISNPDLITAPPEVIVHDGAFVDISPDDAS